MSKIPAKGAEEARNQLPSLLQSAEQGRATIITKHGKPVAALVPVDALGEASKQSALVKLKGSGRGLWGANPDKAIEALRGEWER